MKESISLSLAQSNKTDFLPYNETFSLNIYPVIRKNKQDKSFCKSEINDEAVGRMLILL